MGVHIASFGRCGMIFDQKELIPIFDLESSLPSRTLFTKKIFASIFSSAFQ